MKKIRFLSALLALIMLLGMMTCFTTSVYADDDEDTTDPTETTEPGEDEGEGEGEGDEEEPTSDDPTVVNESGIDLSWLNADGTINYMKYQYKKPEEKLADMQKVLPTSDDTESRYELYIDGTSGEIAYHDTLTDQTLFSNPYALNFIKSSIDSGLKDTLLSQIILSFTNNGSTVYNSYSQCAALDQIEIKRLKDDGIRVEYAIGRIEARRLLPRVIEQNSYENRILNVVKQNVSEQNPKDLDFIMRKMNAFYMLKDPFDPTLTNRALKQMHADFKITKKMAVYVFTGFYESEYDLIERYIKTYCPKYTFEMLEADHDLTEFSGTEKAAPLFRMALEYHIDEDGSLKVRMPCKGLRYVEADYPLEYVRVLPYFGSGVNSYADIENLTPGECDGMLFIPDGSGSLIRYSDFVSGGTSEGGTTSSNGKVITQQVYGQDYAYYNIEGEHQQIVRLPVFGNYQWYNWDYKTSGTVTEIGEDGVAHEVYKTETDNFGESIGFIGIIESGEELVKISSETGSTHRFNTVYTSLYTRANDTYDISENYAALTDSTMVSVRSNKKYTGDYVLRYYMLNGEDSAKKANLKEDQFFTADLNGLADAYRTYLENKGMITRLGADDVKDDIPLYIESFGTIPTQDTVLTFPVTVDTPLTTFEDIKEMYNKLSEAGIGNVKFKLTGFFNGGVNSTYPYKVKAMEEVGGDDGFTDLVNYANDNGFELYPEFDFVRYNNLGGKPFLTFSTSDYLSRSADNRYAHPAIYDPIYQKYTRSELSYMSPCKYDFFFEKFSENYAKYNNANISVAYLGSELVSDFDEDETNLRTHNSEYTVGLFQSLAETYDNVMTTGGNLYSIPYATDILEVPLESSNFNAASFTVPFMGMVLHGYTQFTGESINMAGDLDYQVLRAIENGAAPYFLLSYRNIEKLKQSAEYSKYYSVDFNIWFDDMVNTYKKLNEATNDLQTSLIVKHEFVQAQRVYPQEVMDAIYAEIEYAKKNDPPGEILNKHLAQIEARYIINNGRIVHVTYENGTQFYLNFNNYEITVEAENGQTYDIPALQFVRIG